MNDVDLIARLQSSLSELTSATPLANPNRPTNAMRDRTMITEAPSPATPTSPQERTWQEIGTTPDRALLDEKSLSRFKVPALVAIVVFLGTLALIGIPHFASKGMAAHSASAPKPGKSRAPSTTLAPLSTSVTTTTVPVTSSPPVLLSSLPMTPCPSGYLKDGANLTPGANICVPYAYEPGGTAAQPNATICPPGSYLSVGPLLCLLSSNPGEMVAPILPSPTSTTSPPTSTTMPPTAPPPAVTTKDGITLSVKSSPSSGTLGSTAITVTATLSGPVVAGCTFFFSIGHGPSNQGQPYFTQRIVASGPGTYTMTPFTPPRIGEYNASVEFSNGCGGATNLGVSGAPPSAGALSPFPQLDTTVSP